MKLPKPKKKALVLHSKEGFKYGNCAVLAICSAFSLSSLAFRTIVKGLKIKIDKSSNRDAELGLTFWECKKIINSISEANGLKITYTPNVSKVTYNQLLTLKDNVKLLTMFDIHLSFAEYGIVYDSYIANGQNNYKIDMNDSDDITVLIPTGWWEIKP